MSDMLPSPVPRKLREIFQSHPELLQEVQNGLDQLAAKPSPGTPIFEQAVWVVEDTLSALAQRARDDLASAEQSGDAAAIEAAKSKQSVVTQAKPKQVWLVDLGEFESYAKTQGGRA